MWSKKNIAAVAALLVAYVAPVAADAQSQSSTLSVLSNHLEATVPADQQSFRPLLARKRFEAAGLGSSRIRIAYSVELNRDNTAALPDNSTVAFSTSRKQVGRR